MIQAIIKFKDKELLNAVFEKGGMTPIPISEMKADVYLIVGYPEQASGLEEALGVDKDSDFYVGTWGKEGNQYVWDEEYSYREYNFQSYWDALNDIVEYYEGEDTRRPTKEEALQTQVSGIAGWGDKVL